MQDTEPSGEGALENTDVFLIPDLSVWIWRGNEREFARCLWRKKRTKRATLSASRTSVEGRYGVKTGNAKST